MSLRAKLEDHIEKGTFVKALGALGGLAIAFVLIAGSLPADGGPETARDRGAQQASLLPGFEPTVLPRQEPPFPVEGPDGVITLREIGGDLLAVQFWPRGCGAPCQESGTALGSLAARHEAMRAAAVVLEAYASGQDRLSAEMAETPGLLLLQDRAHNFRRYVGARNGPVTVFYGQDGQEIGRIAGTPDWTGADGFIRGLLAGQ